MPPRLLGALIAVALAAGCVARRPLSPAPASEWTVVLTNARRAAIEGRFADADQTLSSFAMRNEGSPEARESAYWRALFLLDPGNKSATMSAAVEQLDRYLGDPFAPNASEARVIRGLVVTLDSLSRSSAQLRATAVERSAEADPARDKVREELQKENQQLKEQLERANQELERIRRRLAPPKP